MNRTLFASYALAAVVLAAAPFLLDAYWVDVLNSVGLYALLALSLNLILGKDRSATRATRVLIEHVKTSVMDHMSQLPGRAPAEAAAGQSVTLRPGPLGVIGPVQP